MSHLESGSTVEPMGIIALGRRSITYALGGLAYKGVALLAVPVLARLLSPAELGVLDLAAVLATIVGLTAVLGSDQAVAYLEPRTEQESGVWTSTLLIIATITGGCLLVAVLLGASIAEAITGNAADGRVVVAATVYGGVLAVTATALNAIRLHGSPRAYALASFAIVTVEMSVALIIAWRLDSIALMVLGWAGGALVVSAPLLVKFVPAFRPPRVATVRRLAGFGAPLVPAAVAWLVGDAWIRTALAGQLDLSTLGEYGIAFRLVSVVVLVVTGLGVAWQPYIFRSPPDEVHRRTADLLAYVLVGLGLMAVTLTSLAPEVIGVVAGVGYDGAREVIAPMSAGAVALGAFVLLSAAVATSGSTRWIAFAALAGMAIQAVSAFWLIDALGLPGAGVAGLSGYLVAVGVLMIGDRRLLSSAGGPMSVSAVVIIALGLIVADASQAWPVAVRGLFIIGFGGLLALLALAHRFFLRRRGSSASPPPLP